MLQSVRSRACWRSAFPTFTPLWCGQCRKRRSADLRVGSAGMRARSFLPVDEVTAHDGIPVTTVPPATRSPASPGPSSRANPQRSPRMRSLLGDLRSSGQAGQGRRERNVLCTRATEDAEKVGQMASGRLRHLVGLQAAGADVGAKRAAALLDPDLLQVRVEAPLGRDHRVAPGLAEARALAAAVTYLGHRDRGW